MNSLRLEQVRLHNIFDDAVAQPRADGPRYAVDMGYDVQLAVADEGPGSAAAAS